MKEFKILPHSDWPEYDLKVTLKPSFKCNQRCWFCDEYDNNTTTWSKEDCDNVISVLKTIPEDKKKIFFYIYGGEPTLSGEWEYLQYSIVETLPDRELFVQTQTNLSISSDRLDAFLKNISKMKSPQHIINISSSYHLGHQHVDDFISKLNVINIYHSLGFCFFSTEIEKENQFLTEFYKIAKAFPDHIKLKFTQLEGLADRNPRDMYRELLTDPYLLGNDRGESLEYRYFIRKYPELANYLEESWTFDVDGEKLNYIDVKDRGIYRSFRFLKCDAGTNSIVINHDLKVYRCNNYCYSNIDPIPLQSVNMTDYLSTAVRCLAHKCTDGLDHAKYE